MSSHPHPPSASCASSGAPSASPPSRPRPPPRRGAPAPGACSPRPASRRGRRRRRGRLVVRRRHAARRPRRRCRPSRCSTASRSTAACSAIPKAPLTAHRVRRPAVPGLRGRARDNAPRARARLRAHGQGQARRPHAAVHRPGLVRAARPSPPAPQQQGRLWPFLEAFYSAQGQENSGYVTDEFLRSVAEAAGVDAAAALKAANGASAQDQLNRANADAQALGIDSTPTFTVAHGDGKAARARLRRAGPADARRRDRQGAGGMSRAAARDGAVALAGLAIAAYLTVVHYAGGEPVCAVAHGCATVQQSDYAQLAGIPVALLGLLGLRRDPRLARPRRRGVADRDRVPRAGRLRLLGLADLRRGRAARRDLHLVRRLGGVHDAAGGAVGGARAQRAAVTAPRVRRVSA